MFIKKFSRSDLRAFLESRIAFYERRSPEYAGNLRYYLDMALERIFVTLGLIEKHYHVRNGKILEIGSFPFFFTLPLLEMCDDSVTGIVAPEQIWPGEPYEIAKRSTNIETTGKNYPFDYWTCNAEKDIFPFNDETFDMVVCAEVLEHLIQDPGHMIYEINRVLKPGGLLILTTPNGLFWRIIHKMIFFGNHEQYSKYSVYGRHNRLWALDEIDCILTGNNFQVIESRRAYAQEKALDFMITDRLTLQSVVYDLSLLFMAALVNLPIPFLRKKKGDQLYVVAKKTGGPKAYHAERLYAQSKFSYDVKL